MPRLALKDIATAWQITASETDVPWRFVIQRILPLWKHWHISVPDVLTTIGHHLGSWLSCLLNPSHTVTTTSLSDNMPRCDYRAGSPRIHGDPFVSLCKTVHLEVQSYFLIIIFLCVFSIHIECTACVEVKGQFCRVTSLSSFMWVPEIELSSSSFHGKSCYPLSPLASSL